MKKTIFLATALLAAFLFQSCHKIKGEGAVINKEYNLSGFSSVDLGLSADVYYTQDNFYRVEIQAQQNIQDIIQTPIVNGELKLEFEKYKNIWKHDRIVIYITAPSLSGLGINGSGNIHVLQPMTSGHITLKINGSGNINIQKLTAETLTANISGSGNIAVNDGSVNNEALKISGSGSIDLLGLNAKFAATETSGSGNTRVRVSDNLNVRISGSGDVFYIGNPSLYSSISGSGKITRLQ